MKYTQYISLIQRLEGYAAENPQQYELRVAALGVLGYVYFFGIILSFLAIPLIMLGLFWIAPVMFWILIKIALKIVWLIVLGIGAFFIFLANTLRSLWREVPEPVGIVLSRENAPKVFALAEQTSGKLNASFPDRILLTEDYNAAVVTLPRFGMFGKKIFLLAGLPLMQALSPEQFEAVVAHEFGHISRRHGRFSAWIYRLHETWERFLNSQEQYEHRFAFLYTKFVNWYFPFFSAYSFVLMRRHEREADQDAARLFGAKPLGEALVNLEVRGEHLAQNFWRKILDQAAHQTKPPERVFSQMALAFREQGGDARDAMNLAKAVAVRTDYQNAHPSLAERLKLIGYWDEAASDLPDLPAPATETAADVFLGEKSVEEFASQFDAAWQARVEADWQARHNYLAEIQKRLDELEKKIEPLSADEIYERAMLTAEKYGAETSVPLLRQAVEQFPENANVNYSLGAVLLGDGHEEGIEFLETAKRLDATARAAADEQIYEYLRRKGRDAEAKTRLEEIERQYEIIERAQKERQAFAPTDDFLKHDLAAEKLAAVLQTLSYNEEIRAAYLVRKAVAHLPEIPYHVLLLDVKIPRFKFGGVTAANVMEAVANQVGNNGIDFVVLLEKEYAGLKKRLEQNAETRIYQKPS